MTKATTEFSIVIPHEVLDEVLTKVVEKHLESKGILSFIREEIKKEVLEYFTLKKKGKKHGLSR